MIIASQEGFDRDHYGSEEVLYFCVLFGLLSRVKNSCWSCSCEHRVLLNNFYPNLDGGFHIELECIATLTLLQSTRTLGKFG